MKNLRVPKSPSPPDAHLVHFPKHAQLIAMIISEWNFLEHGLIILLALIMRTESEAILRMLKSLRNSGARLDVIEAGIVDEFPPGENEFHDLLTDLLKKCRKALGRRNAYAHAYFYTANGKTLLMVNPGRMGNQTGYERVVSLTELKKTHKDIHDLSEDAVHFCEAFHQANAEDNNSSTN